MTPIGHTRAFDTRNPWESRYDGTPARLTTRVTLDGADLIPPEALVTDPADLRPDPATEPDAYWWRDEETGGWFGMLNFDKYPESCPTTGVANVSDWLPRGATRFRSME